MRYVVDILLYMYQSTDYRQTNQGDHVRATAVRRVQNISSTGSTESHRIRLHLTLAVTRVEWTPAISAGESSTAATNDSLNPGSSAPSTSGLQISGRVASENPHVKMGAFHTLDLEANRDVRIEKEEGGWDSVALNRVEESCVPGRGAEVAAVVCGEGAVSSPVSTSRSNWRYRDGDILLALSVHDSRPASFRCFNTSQACY